MNCRVLFAIFIAGTLFQSSVSLAAASGIELNTTAQAETTADGEPVWGWADLHAHQFANLGFGGNLVVGSPSGSPNSALVDPVGMGAPHGENLTCVLPTIFGCLLSLSGDPIGDVLRSGDPQAGHDRRGYPGFQGWPSWNTFNHQTMYYKWLERAFLGGQKLMVMLAVNNELLCDVHGEVSGNRPGYNCKDMPAVNRQIAAIKDMEAYVDMQDDGLLNGTGWYKVATDPQQARETINAGNMAVVIGIEVDNLFSCTKNSNCTEEQILTKLDTFHDLGVRHVFPMHVFDNGFGGAAVYDDSMFNLGNRLLNGQYFRVQECTEGNDFKLKNVPASLRFLATLLLGEFPGQPSYSSELTSHCNRRGITATGEQLIYGLMDRGMLIDVDHMSNLMFDRVLNIAIEEDYPLVASHSTPLGILKSGNKAEGRRTDEQLAAIHSLGGMIALNLSSKPRNVLKQYGTTVPFTCSFSAQGWAQSYLYSIDVMQGEGLLSSVGMGTDFNGFVTAPAPRFGGNACGSTNSTGAVGAKVFYPFQAHGKAGEFEQQVSAQRTFNINNDGLAHVGLLPDFVEELKVLGVSDAQLEPLFRSAEKYLQMWEKAESIAYPPVPEPELPASVLISASKVAGDSGWIDGELDLTLSLEWPEQDTSIFYELTGATSTSVTEATGDVQISLSNTGETVLSYYSYNSSTQLQSATVSTLISIDNDSPLASVSSVEPNSNGWHNQDVEVFLDAFDLGSGVQFLHYRVNDDEWVSVTDSSLSVLIVGEGTSTVEVVAEDFTGKRSDTESLVVMLDKTAPELQIVSAESNANGWHNQDIEISLNASDLGSGIDFIEYRLNEAEWLTIAATNHSVMIDTEGSNTIEAVAVDFAGLRSEIGSLILQLDKTAPELVCSSEPARLWPPNNKLVDVSNNVVFADNFTLSDQANIILASLTEEAGGNTRRSLNEGWVLGEPDYLGQLRASKSAQERSDRIYTMTYLALDLAGNEGSCDTLVTVPHSNSTKSEK